MKVQLVHNPTAGNANHIKDDLISKLKKNFEEVNYVSTEELGWKNFLKKEPDLIFLGGGDGTFHKLAEVLLEADVRKQKTPVSLLPLGTANNIAKTLGFKKGHDSNYSLSGKSIGNFDVGTVKTEKSSKHIFEGVGFGIFPRLVAEMEKAKNKSDDPQEELQRSHEVLLKLVKKYEPQQAQLQIEEETLQGTYLLVELMNIKYIGPNSELAPNATPGDGEFDLVTVSSQQRDAFVEYLEQVVKGNSHPANFSEVADIRKTRSLKMKWEGKDVHLDDDPLSNYAGEFLEVKIKPAALQVYRSSPV